jgi:glycosyltransferase involved in cell wall biosynthesis
MTTVSVIVAAYDEEEHLDRLLRSLQAQTLAPLEVIVADDGSRDRTADVAEAAGARVLRLAHRGPAVARNEAARVARGDVLALLDGDMACEPEFLERLVEPIAEGRAIGTFTREMYIGNTDNRWARAYAALRWSPPDRLLPADFPDRWEAFRAIRADAFAAAGGFDDVGYGEDTSLAAKVGELAHVAPGAVCYHHHPSSLREVFENGRWVGRGEAIRSLPHPWWDHFLPRALVIGLRQVLAGRTLWLLPARAVYHSGVWLGLAESARDPYRHWK